MTEQQATDPQYWAEHLRKPVRFSEAVVRMWSETDGDPDRILIELGPRRTLATLSKQHATDPKNQISIPTLSKLRKTTQSGPACWAPLLNFGSPVWRLTGAASVQTVSQERVDTRRCQRMRFNGSNTSLPPETQPHPQPKHRFKQNQHQLLSQQPYLLLVRFRLLLQHREQTPFNEKPLS